MAETQPVLWIFAYGSLMWRPDFAFAEHHRATVTGYRRALCIYSHHYRGTEERPGLVFGLDRGGSCTGIAFRIADEHHGRVLDAVRTRELITSVYLERLLPVTLSDGRTVTAVSYVADPDHSQYAGSLTQNAMLPIVCRAVGSSGSDIDYVRSTRDHLRVLGVVDHNLERLCSALDLWLAECRDPAGVAGLHRDT